MSGEKVPNPWMFREYTARPAKPPVRTLTLISNASVIPVMSGKSTISEKVDRLNTSARTVKQPDFLLLPAGWRYLCFSCQDCHLVNIPYHLFLLSTF
ncbi:hypothetical protein [Methanosarcina sp.]|uniref:hypothetical protein n=1 Tax=Methanosarcina sp. TaxID=2213 RepID=UPI003A102B50